MERFLLLLTLCNLPLESPVNLALGSPYDLESCPSRRSVLLASAVTFGPWWNCHSTKGPDSEEMTQWNAKEWFLRCKLYEQLWISHMTLEAKENKTWQTYNMFISWCWLGISFSPCSELVVEFWFQSRSTIMLIAVWARIVYTRQCVTCFTWLSSHLDSKSVKSVMWFSFVREQNCLRGEVTCKSVRPWSGLAGRVEARQAASTCPLCSSWYLFHWAPGRLEAEC